MPSLAIPGHVQGRSLRAVGAGDNTGRRSTLAGEFHQHGERPFFPRRALRDARYQIIRNLLNGKVSSYASVDGDSAPNVARTAKYEGPPARKAMKLLPNPPEWELYDLEADLWQFHNLAGPPSLDQRYPPEPPTEQRGKGAAENRPPDLTRAVGSEAGRPLSDRAGFQASLAGRIAGSDSPA